MATVIKRFTAVSYEYSLYARVFVPGKPFQDSLVFEGMAGAYPSETTFKCSSQGKAPGLGWKGLPGTNALAHY